MIYVELRQLQQRPTPAIAAAIRLLRAPGSPVVLTGLILDPNPARKQDFIEEGQAV